MLKAPVLLLLTALLWTGCRDKPKPETLPPGEEPAQTEPVKTPELKAPGNLIPVKPWSGPPALKIYYDREPLSQEWLKRWTAGANHRILQVKLPLENAQPLPQDGDLYVVSPPLVPKMRGLLDWHSPQELIPLDQLKPLFTGHSFDPSNRISLPWRWSPYVFYRKKENPEQTLPAFVFSGWTISGDSCWPDNPALLWAMKRHLNRSSANAPVNDVEIKSLRALKEQLEGHTLPEEECWKQFSEGKVKTTFALAAWRIRTPAADDSSIQWVIPPEGTLLQFDQLMIPAKSPFLPAVKELVRLLLSIEGQNDLEGVTGYFPVRTGIKTATNPAKAKLPEGLWMDNSEFPVLDLNALLAEPLPAPPVEPAVEPTPASQPEGPASSSSMTLNNSRGPKGF